MTSPSTDARPPRSEGAATTKRSVVTLDGLRQLRQRIEHRQLEPGDWPVVGALVSKQIAHSETRLRRMLARIEADAAAGDATASPPGADEPTDTGESTDSAAGPDENATSSDKPEAPADAGGQPGSGGSKKPKGHGRNGASAYRNAQHLFHALALGVVGALCKACGFGTMYSYKDKIVVRIIGQPLFAAEQHHYEQARCRQCGHIVRADGPACVHEGTGSDYIRYDWSAGAMLIVMHYFAGMPFKRLESLHEGWGIPLSDSNQWTLVDESGDLLLPLYKTLEQNEPTGPPGQPLPEAHRQVQDPKLAPGPPSARGLCGLAPEVGEGAARGIAAPEQDLQLTGEQRGAGCRPIAGGPCAETPL